MMVNETQDNPQATPSSAAQEAGARAYEERRQGTQRLTLLRWRDPKDVHPAPRQG
ncbi:hypothetical protein [Variovorax ginsengisoli]|uniref:Uncharacterized protein n=1 Tax=Variovorax ginsengisoli TaxID=363844 RepID=A0ABT8SCG2_9BURK|nr:hypothetical protein [Variovorax ginsengisoli]MDN8617437.1 hypothetical protein [Variovorax ginsengisoli]MDO1536607.1 hypothetical protein [Variovorax ginsengisoli]